MVTFHGLPWLSTNQISRNLGSSEPALKITRCDTVLLPEGYHRLELIGEDPLIAVRKKFGELMQEGYHEHKPGALASHAIKDKRRNTPGEVSRQVDLGDELGSLSV